jgi:hypothetical protein
MARNIGQHVDHSPSPNNGQRSSRGAGNVGGAAGARSPAQVGQMSGGEIQQRRSVPKPDCSADTIINGTGDSSEGGYGGQNVKDD